MGTNTDPAASTSAAPRTDPRPLTTLLRRLEQRLVEVERLQQDLLGEARALAEAVSAADAAPRSVLSVKEAAAELGISESMLHKLLKQRRLGHLKVGARTLITPEQLARFDGGVNDESRVAIEMGGGSDTLQREFDALSAVRRTMPSVQR